MPNFMKENFEKAGNFKFSVQKKDSKEKTDKPEVKNKNQKTANSFKSSKKTKSADSVDGHLKVKSSKSALKSSQNNASSSNKYLTTMSKTSQTGSASRKEQFSVTLASQSAVIKSESRADSGSLKSKSSDFFRNSKSSNASSSKAQASSQKSISKSTATQSYTPTSISSENSTSTGRESTSSMSSLARQLQSSIVNTPKTGGGKYQKRSAYHSKSSMVSGVCAQTKSPPHEVMVPAGQVYKVVKVGKEGIKSQLANGPYEYVWKYCDNHEKKESEQNIRNQTESKLLQTSTQVLRQPKEPSAGGVTVQVIQGPNLHVTKSQPLAPPPSLPKI